MTKEEQDKADAEDARLAAAGGAGGGDVLDSTDPVVLANALRLEQAKTKVLVDEVVALEDELTNRALAECGDAITDETREFWREQLLTNRAAATVALAELVRAKEGSRFTVHGSRETEPTPGPSKEGSRDSTRRPLHNRAASRPVAPAAAGGPAGVVTADGDARAAAIRNRAQEISKNERLPFSQAFRRAETELAGK